MVSMATHYGILKNGIVPTNILLTQQQLILVHSTSYQINSKTYNFYLWSDISFLILMKTFEMNEKSCKNQGGGDGGLLTKLLISQSLNALEYQT